VKALKRDEANGAEIKNAEEKPASDFYEYGKKKEARRSVGLNPFADKALRKKGVKRKVDSTCLKDEDIPELKRGMVSN